jgi:L-aminopeptidase/D-esterase-like protein
VDLGVTGVSVGHWTNPVARTGCTVVVLPPGTVASGEVRGGAPATREFALLDPTRLVGAVDAVVLSGGSAFGLAAADGVVDALAAEGRGFATSAGPIPIVVAMSLFDLLVGDAAVRPGPVQGAAALASAATDVELGAVGAGTGATVGKWRGREHARPGGLGGAVVHDGELVVAALIAVNAFGDVVPLDHDAGDTEVGEVMMGDGFTNTTIGVVLTNAAIDKVGCHLLAQRAHDGLARAIVPTHTAFDGDAIVAAATGTLPLGSIHPDAVVALERVRLGAALAVERATRSVAG